MATTPSKRTPRGGIAPTHAEIVRSLKTAQRHLEQMQKRYSDAVPSGDRKMAFPDIAGTVNWYGANKDLFKPQTRESGMSGARAGGSRTPAKKRAKTA